MDGTFGGGDLISASLAIMLGGGTDAELHDKEVALTTSDVTGSQTAIFEYDPQNEPVSGDPAGPWDGYSLFTIDLSAVKDDIEDLQQQIADAEACRQQVISVLQQYDPDYDPAEGECPASKVDDLYDDYYEDEQTIADLQEQIEECDQCKADVIAKLQEYDPDFDPQTCSDIPPEIDKVVEEKEGYEFPEGTDPTDPTIPPLLKGDPLKDETLGGIAPAVRVVITLSNNYWGMSGGYIDSDGQFVSLVGWNTGVNAYEYPELKPEIVYAKIIDPTTGTMEYKVNYTDVGGSSVWVQTATAREMIGYGDPSHRYKVRNS